jgi:hypothetical protein
VGESDKPMTTSIQKFDVDTLTLPPGVTLLDDNRDYTNRFDFTSESGNVYRVAQHKNSRWWACDCPSWKFNRDGKRCCKHLRAFGIPGNYQAFEVGQLAISGSTSASKVLPISGASAAKAVAVAPAAAPRSKGVKLPARSAKALPATPESTDALKPKNVAINGDEIIVTFDAKDAAKVFALLATLA